MTAVIPVMTARDVRKTFRRGTETVHALDGAWVTLQAGELVALVGRSGSGKSTLLNVLAGWEHPDSGTLSWGSDQAARTSDLRWDDLAVVPQSLGLIEELSVRANVELPSRLAGTLEQERDRVDHLIEHFGLRELQLRMPPETSLGEQQRTALARALVLQPRLLLADEPTGHQDATWATRVISALTVAAGEGTSCFVATHSEEVATFASRVLHMHDGKVTVG